MRHSWHLYVGIAIVLIMIQFLYGYFTTPTLPSDATFVIPEKNVTFCSPILGETGNHMAVSESTLSVEQLESRHTEVLMGGSWKPTTCHPRQNVAIVVPYRDRPLHLRLFLDHMHSFLQRQQLAYTVLLIQQASGSQFNRGMLLNIGFREATARGEFDCIVFHDVDLLPEDIRIPYTCINQPRHLAVARSKKNYKPSYKGYVGGVLAMRPRDFITINGFSNAYFAWGSEDDDLSHRMKSVGVKVNKIPLNIGRYKDVKHQQAEKMSFGRRKGLVTMAAKRMYVDGLVSLNPSMFTIHKAEQWKLFTRLLVSIKQKNTWLYVKSLFKKLKKDQLL